MLSMGLTLELSDFKRAFGQKTAVLLGLALQYTIMPIGALTVSLLLGVDKSLMVGMVLVGSVAGGTASNVMGVDLLERQEIFLNQSVRGSENAKEASLW